jgi:hypothetical protein
LKIISVSSKSERDILLSTVADKYKIEFDALEKNKKNIKDYNVQFNNLTTARKIEEAAINKKYDDGINEYLKSVQSDTINSYDKTIDEINKTIDEKLKNAMPEQKVKLGISRVEQVTKLTKLKTLDETSQAATAKVTNVENDNRPNESDTPEEAATKIQNINAAKLEAEDASFELKKAQAAGQNVALLQLAADHAKNVLDINEATTNANIDLAQKEKDAKIATWQAVGNGLGALGQLAGEQTAAGKGLAIAEATIQTYLGASKEFGKGGILGCHWCSSYCRWFSQRKKDFSRKSSWGKWCWCIILSTCSKQYYTESG